MSLAGERRWIAAEDAGLYRDALGAVPPAGLPAVFLAPVEQPLEQLLRRYARCHGPFLSEQPARRFAPLRFLGGAARGRAGRTLAGGRWSLVAHLLDPPSSPTGRALARAEMLLERYGVVSREASHAEQLPGGFAPLYPVLRAMEERGRVRRGYFVEGLSGAQFARPGCADRLRAARETEPPLAGYGEAHTLALAAVDPANPYGALLPWPETVDHQAQPRRVAGAWLVLVAGRPVLYLGPGCRDLVSFCWESLGPGGLGAACHALRHLPRAGRRRSLLVERIDGVPSRESPLAEPLLVAGFVADYKGLAAPPPDSPRWALRMPWRHTQSQGRQRARLSTVAFLPVAPE